MFFVFHLFWCFCLICLVFNLMLRVVGLKGFLDGQFGQLQLLQDESNPDFVVEVVSLFFEDSERILNDLTLALWGSLSLSLSLSCVCVCFRISISWFLIVEWCVCCYSFLGNIILEFFAEISRMWTSRRLMLMFTSSKVAVLGKKMVI